MYRVKVWFYDNPDEPKEFMGVTNMNAADNGWLAVHQVDFSVFYKLDQIFQIERRLVADDE